MFHVPQLKKPRGIWCNHVVQGKGCSIFDKPERPAVCGAFTCAWLDGYGTDAERPDKTRVVFMHCTAPFGPVLAIYETVEGALDARPIVKRETEAALARDVFVLQLPLGKPPRLHVPQSRTGPGRRLSDEDFATIRQLIGAFQPAC